ncbi:hypothetical protein DPMN_088483 [Dreissena polymorpha]|uniref:Uncharacterized protein n=1 Tax=Dreissena polymorpha TaxID=45954 RepID=A0A9D4KU62_DREPO|nr:hypothetical protein DPMN_088483 [Dreissena polymorpha]
MIINGINDKKCSEQLMEILADQLTLERVIQTCRHIELTNAQIKTLQEHPTVHVARPDKYGKRGAKQNSSNSIMSFAKSVAKCMRLNFVQHSTKDAMHVVKRDIFRRLAIVEDVQQLKVVGSTVVAQGQAVAMVVVVLTFVYFAEEDEFYDMFEQNTSTHDVYTVQNNGNETNNKEWTVKMKVNNKHLRLEIDSGVQCNVLS